jgi:hypothetical protein
MDKRTRELEKGKYQNPSLIEHTPNPSKVKKGLRNWGKQNTYVKNIPRHIKVDGVLV